MKTSTPSAGPTWGAMVHALRVLAFVAIVVLIHLQHRAFVAAHSEGAGAAPPMDHVRALFPAAQALRDSPESQSVWEVLDGEGQRLGSVLQSAPDSNTIIGFSGPSNVLIGFDQAGRIVGLDILSSRDTPEHVARVIQDPKFLRGLNGLTWQQAATRPQVDAVSGATLTSLAMIEGVQRRLGGHPASFKFPAPIAVKDVRTIFPEADKIVPDPGNASVIRIFDKLGQSLGWALRTSPSADNIIGYQGPTDALIAFDIRGRIHGIAVGKSYDNEPYVRYVREDDAWRTLFKGQTIEELAGLDLKGSDVEGVAGATMTSMAVVKGMILAANQKLANQQKPPAAARSWWGISWSDAGTALVVIAGMVMGFTNLRGRGRLRVAYQLLVFGYLGLVNGALLSQAQLVGWSQAGVPTGAGGLILLTVAALAVPIATRRNLYCTHLCPHGALQQLALRYARPRRVLPPRLRVLLSMIPAGLLLFTLIVALTHLPFSLVNIEPFDAYIVRVAGGATLVIALVGAIAALFVPMAYCRYGCPTGKLLEFLRRNGRSDRLTLRDGLAVLCVLGAAVFTLAKS